MSSHERPTVLQKREMIHLSVETCPLQTSRITNSLLLSLPNMKMANYLCNIHINTFNFHRFMDLIACFSLTIMYKELYLVIKDSKCDSRQFFFTHDEKSSLKLLISRYRCRYDFCKDSNFAKDEVSYQQLDVLVAMASFTTSPIKCRNRLHLWQIFSLSFFPQPYLFTN